MQMTTGVLKRFLVYPFRIDNDGFIIQCRHTGFKMQTPDDFDSNYLIPKRLNNRRKGFDTFHVGSCRIAYIKCFSYFEDITPFNTCRQFNPFDNAIVFKE